ncbi:hypothetical protein GFS31_09540 [Leptolyngbya sp. BL0902]|nr:hypothetical protein GFS31_09540 [Leptolyngbya sp. BL0902]
MDLLAMFGITDTAMNPDGLMAAGTRQSNIEAAVQVLRRAGIPANEALEAWVSEQFDLADRDLIPKARHTPPFPGTGAMLQRLKQGGLKIGVLSSDGGANVAEFLRHHHLMTWVDDWQGTEAHEPPKPAPDLLYRLGQRMGVEVAHTVIVGDSWADHALAQNAGIPFISVSDAWGRPPIAGADFVLHTWDDLRTA